MRAQKGYSFFFIQTCREDHLCPVALADPMRSLGPLCPIHFHRGVKNLAPAFPTHFDLLAKSI